MRRGADLHSVVKEFLLALNGTGTRLVAHNIAFDLRVVDAELRLLKIDFPFGDLPRYCTMLNTVELCGIPKRGGGLKWPSLQELHLRLFGQYFQGAHNAENDVNATVRCFFELMRLGEIAYR